MNARTLVSLFALLLAAAGCGRQAPIAPPGTVPRIVSLAPNLTEVVATVGAQELLVGRTSACDYPPEVVRRVPIVGGFGVPSLEALIAVNPTLIIDVDLEDESAVNTFRELGIQYRRVPCHRLADIPVAMRVVGELTGHDAEADAAATELERQLDVFRRQTDARTWRPRVYIEIWHDPVMTAGNQAYLSDIIELAGGRNVAADIDKGYFQASPEWVVEQDPDVIVCAYMSTDGSIPEVLRRRPGWGAIRAVRNGLVFDGLDNDVILRPGPRVAAGVAALHACIAKAPEP